MVLPALTCAPVSDAFYHSFTSKVTDFESESTDEQGYEVSMMYFAWASETIPSFDSTTFSSLDQSTSDVAKIYLYFGFYQLQDDDGAPVDTLPGMIECSLRNASFDLEVEYANSQQKLTVKDRKFLNDVSFNQTSMWDKIAPPSGQFDLSFMESVTTYALISQVFNEVYLGSWIFTDIAIDSTARRLNNNSIHSTLIQSTPFFSLNDLTDNLTLAQTAEQAISSCLTSK